METKTGQLPETYNTAEEGVESAEKPENMLDAICKTSEGAEELYTANQEKIRELMKDIEAGKQGKAKKALSPETKVDEYNVFKASWMKKEAELKQALQKELKKAPRLKKETERFYEEGTKIILQEIKKTLLGKEGFFKTVEGFDLQKKTVEQNKEFILNLTYFFRDEGLAKEESLSFIQDTLTHNFGAVYGLLESYLYNKNNTAYLEELRRGI